ncbi:MAG TPA: thiamine phosphate synthase [Alphaproteobacteria bacterium]|nr:thiamine phosphate synthase [Alphaproteobacteria bacterium]
MSRADCRLYLLTPPDIVPAAFAPLLQAALEGGDVACVQLRLAAGADDAAWREAVRLLRPIAQDREVAFLLDGRPELAKELGCDGVHVANAKAVRAARKLLGEDAIVGVTCGDSRHEAMVGGEDGADYVSFGSIFLSQTIPFANTAPLELVTWWAEMMELPCVAVGGITLDTAAQVADAGADFLGLCHAVWHHAEGPAAAVKAFNAALAG